MSEALADGWMQWESSLSGVVQTGTGSAGASADEAPFQFKGTAREFARVGGIFAAVDGRVDDLTRMRGGLGPGDAASVAEVAAAAYDRYGEEFADKLTGDFAAVVWDSARRKLVLARDSGGLVQLLYAHEGGELRFATDARTLLALGDMATEVDEQGLAAWLMLEMGMSQRTLLKGILCVPAGGVVVFEDGRVRVRELWRPESLPELRLRDSREYAEQMLAVLRQAVVDRLPCEGVVASQLSGGLDSSSVTALAAEALAQEGRGLLALTAVPGEEFVAPYSDTDRFCDERAHAAAVAAMYSNVRHELVPNRGTRLLEVLDRFTDAEARPMPNPDHLLWVDRTYAAAQSAGAGTFLVGTMGNISISHRGDYAMAELLARGHVGKAMKLAQAYRRDWKWTRRRIVSLALQRHLQMVFNVTDRWRNKQYALEDFSGVNPRFAKECGMDLRARQRRFLFRSGREARLALLRRNDAGVGVRAAKLLYGLDRLDPTLDRRVMEFCISVPEEIYAEGGVPRALIRNAMVGRLPEVVRTEQRRGLQSADFLARFAREREEIVAELDRMMEVDLARRALDVEKAREWVRWSEAQVKTYGWHNYMGRITRTLTIGRFLRRVADGSLFSTNS